MTEWKRTKGGLVEGHSLKERLMKWFNYFRGLLGTTSAGEEEEIPPIVQNLNISDGPFTVNQFAKAKNTLREVKSVGRNAYPKRLYKPV